MKYQKLENLREDSDLTQRQLSEILHITSRAYCHYEQGSRDIPIEVLIRLADYYNTSLDYLLDRTMDRDPYPKSGQDHIDSTLCHDDEKSSDSLPEARDSQSPREK